MLPTLTQPRSNARIWFDKSGAAAGFAWPSDDRLDHFSLFEPVGCHSAHRQPGLTKAVMFEGMRRLRDRGAVTASVVSHPIEAAANRRYASAGFTAIDVNVN